jgi:adenine phosphoribosyltransferase
VAGLAEELAGRFAWVDSHADVWRWLDDGILLRRIVTALGDPYRSEGVSLVAGIEARGFLLAGAVAVDLGAGVLPIRKDGGLFPGEKIARVTPPDYRGRSANFRMQRRAGSGDRVLLVDDWAETGSQALTARAMVLELGATFVGASLIVDQLDGAVRDRLGRVAAILAASALPDDG